MDHRTSRLIRLVSAGKLINPVYEKEKISEVQAVDYLPNLALIPKPQKVQVWSGYGNFYHMACTCLTAPYLTGSTIRQLLAAAPHRPRV